MNKKSMSVTEMRKLLGIGKTDSYWLVKKKYFETVIIAGKMRVMVESFDNWYDISSIIKRSTATHAARTGRLLQCRCRKQPVCLAYRKAHFMNC